jgi:ABC-2 type transport system permease protein
MKSLSERLETLMSNVWTVIRYTYLNRVKSKAFIISTLIFAVVISAVIYLPSIIDAFTSDKPAAVGMIEDKTGTAVQLQQLLQANEQPKASIVLMANQGSNEQNEAVLRDMLEAGEIKGFLLATDADVSEGAFPKFVYKSTKLPGGSLKSELTTALTKLKNDAVVRDLKLTPDQVSRLSKPVALESVQLSITEETGGGKTEEERATAYVLVYVLVFFIFMIVMMYGNLIATEVTAEKSSRVMEILITSVSPLVQMFGKIIGIFLLALTQTLVFVLVAVVNFLPQKDKIQEFGLSLEHLDLSLIIYFFLYFVLGFILYATLLAGIGSLVSRTEDLGQAIMPVTLFSVVGFYISIYGLSDPNSGFVTAMSYVPFFTPMLMFLRIGMVGVPFWEVALSFLVLIAAILLFGYLAAKMYRVGVLMYGKRPSWKELWKAMKAYRV